MANTLPLPANQVGSPCDSFSVASGRARQMARSRARGGLSRCGRLLWRVGTAATVYRPGHGRITGMTPHRLKLLGAFFLIYFVWGSNFLAIRYALESIPPFLLMGVRSLLAGLCLYAWARLRGAERPARRHWRAAAAVGVLLFLGCHGLLAWAQRSVPSGVAALGLATIAIWMTLLDWLWAGARRPDVSVWVGLALGA